MAVELSAWDDVDPLQSFTNVRTIPGRTTDQMPHTATTKRESHIPSTLQPQQRREELSATHIDSELLHELDRLIELHQQKVDVLLRMRHDISRAANTQTAHRADHTLEQTTAAESTSDPTPLSTHSRDSPLSVSQSRRSRQRSSSSSEPFSFSSVVPQLVQRGALFLTAIAVLVVYQYVQHRRGQRPANNTSRAWEDEWMARRRRQEALEQQSAQQPSIKALDVAGVRRRRMVAAVGAEQSYHEEGKELRVESEVYEQRDSGEWDEAAGDYWDASDSRHEGYVGVFGIEDDEKEADEDEPAATGGGGMVVDDVDDDDEYEEEQEELPDDDEQG